ncbi:Hypothetical predicted protein, partial [Paramuricea clavata]
LRAAMHAGSWKRQEKVSVLKENNMQENVYFDWKDLLVVQHQVYDNMLFNAIYEDLRRR